MSTPSITATRLTGFGRGKETTFPKERIELGTGEECDLRFDPTWDKTVAKNHATVYLAEGRLWVEAQNECDVRIEGRRISREEIPAGGAIELGKDGPKVRFEFVPAPSAASSAPESGAPRIRMVPKPQQPAPVPRAARWGPIVVGLLLLLAVGAGLWHFSKGPRGRESGAAAGTPSADAGLAQAVAQKGEGVGVVVATGYVAGEGGTPVPYSVPFGTAWAIEGDVFVTNSHVAEPVARLLETGVFGEVEIGEPAVFIVINGRPDIRLRVTGWALHPRYGEETVSPEGRSPAVPAYDVALLEVERPAPVHWTPAPKAELEALGSGTRVGYLGFPMENIAGGGINLSNPSATMQAGIVTTATDYYLAKSPFEDRHLVQHNLGAAGGASGSPVFNAKGEVVAVLSAGNVHLSVNFGSLLEALRSGNLDMASIPFERIPSGALINYAQRIDLVTALLADFNRFRNDGEEMSVSSASTAGVRKGPSLARSSLRKQSR